MLKTTALVTPLIISKFPTKTKCQDPPKKPLNNPETYNLNKNIFLKKPIATTLFNAHPEILEKSIPEKIECDHLRKLVSSMLPNDIPAECQPEQIGELTKVCIPRSHKLFKTDLGEIKRLFETK
jgi:hypothetical protein